MEEDINITILIENTAHKAGLKTEHGLSFWIEYGDKNILFDTGQSNAVMKNAKKLSVNLACTDAIVISHGHYDHTGGLSTTLDIAPKAKIYLHPAATESKFNKKDSNAKYIGMPDSAKKAIEGRHVVWMATPAYIFPGIAITGQVPRMSDFEDVGGAFYVDENCQNSDKLLDDQALFIESAKGLIVVLGCAHSGVVNTLDYISNLTGQNKVYAVIGGMHLLNASQMRIENTIETLKKYEVQKAIPLHCTGQKAVEDFKNTIDDKCLFLGTGDKISFKWGSTLNMSNKELKLSSICESLSRISNSDWVAVKFEKRISTNDIKHVRFCEAVYQSQKKAISLSFADICCDGAKRCFGWLKNNDVKLAQKLSEKTGFDHNVARELVRRTPVLREKFSGISLGKDIDGDVYISYANPASTMKLVRTWQKMTGQNLDSETSGIMSVCGNIAVKSYINQKISISFGCPDSREYGSIEKGQLVIGIPHNLALRICEFSC